MKQFLFPAVFFKDEDIFTVLFPDLNITTEGETVEEAYLFAKDRKIWFGNRYPKQIRRSSAKEPKRSSYACRLFCYAK